MSALPKVSRRDSTAALRSSLNVSVGAAARDFESLLEASHEPFLIINSDGEIQNANRHARELLHLSDASLPAAKLADFLSLPSNAPIAWANAKFHSAHLTNGFPVRINLRAILPESQNLLLCLDEVPVVERAEIKWRHAEAELRAVLESVDAGILMLDRNGRVRFSSLRFGQFFGLDRRELEKIRNADELETLLADRFRNPSSFGAPWRAFLEGKPEPTHDELELMRPAPRVIERFSRPIVSDGARDIGWIEVYSDVTGERQIRAKMLQTEKMAALGQLVSGIAHELNNPLTTIMGYGQLLLGHGLSQNQHAEAIKIYQEAERARRIVKNLLYFARENKPERTRADLNEIVERTLALRSYELKVEDIIVECDLAPELPKTMADPHQLQQVVLNLLVNAEQSLLQDRGKGHVWIRTRFQPRNGQDRILLEISDDGPGIPRAIASRIFDPFFTTKPSGVGTGLGLSIVYGIVEQHGGEVMFESLPSKPTKFSVDLPVIPVPVSRSATYQDLPQSRDLRHGRILVVEDEPTVAQLIVDVLKEEGHQVEATVDSQEGLTRISREHFDLVICDLRMLRLDGRAFHDALVRSGSPAQDHILYITGDTIAPQTLEFLEPNGFPYLAKPFLVEELKIAVARLLTAPQEKERVTAGSEQKK